MRKTFIVHSINHSIIIPCRNRWRNVGLCVWSINHSAKMCGIVDYEIVVIDNRSDSLPWWAPYVVRVTRDDSYMPIFNKPRLQNRGIKVSECNVLTFLDADALVGKRWMENVERLADPTLTKLCYRVRRLPEYYGNHLDTTLHRDELLDSWFADYDTFPQSHEAYGLPERNQSGPGILFGNSHFSIRRDVLGDLRYNEEYVGRGHEDLWFLRELWLRDPDHYRAEIVTDPDHAVFNLENPNGNGGPDWYDPGQARANTLRYNSSWPKGTKRRLLNEMKNAHEQLPADVILDMLEL